MKITVFNSSPRAEKGNTHVMVKEFIEGAISAGAEVENIFLAKKKIQHCMACSACIIKTPGKCVIKDDAEELLEKLFASDIVVHASPMHIGSITSLHKALLGRSCPYYDMTFDKDEQTGLYRCAYRIKNPPPIVLISNCCMPEQEHFKFFNGIFKSLEFNTNTKIIAEIYRGGGEILQVDHPALKEPLENYKKLLRKAGEEVVKHRQLSEQTKLELEKPLLAPDDYVKMMAEYMQEMVTCS